MNTRASSKKLSLLVACIMPLALCNSAYAEVQKPAEPKPFIDLYHDFTGIHDRSAKTIAQELANALEKREQMGADGPLVLVVESGIYIYDYESHKLIAKVNLRSTDPTGGFIELTAISHVGPAIAYLANLKELNNPYWREGLKNLLRDIKAVRATNADTAGGNWLDGTSSKAMQMRKTQVRAMVDYACYMAGSYIESVLLDDGKNFTTDSVSSDFYNGESKKYPIPYKNVMVGTFAMVALNDAYRAYLTLKDKDINWSKAKVLFQFHAGTNYGGGITKDSNHLYQLLSLISKNKLTEDRIFFTPYAEQRASIGQAVMPEADFDYYTKRVWYHQYARPKVAISGCFKSIDTIYLPNRPSLPGDRDYTSADNIDDFMIRMKYSLSNNTQLLSNTIGFWMSAELDRNGWDARKVQIPGVTSGFPEGIAGYPKQNPSMD